MNIIHSKFTTFKLVSRNQNIGISYSFQLSNLFQMLFNHLLLLSAFGTACNVFEIRDDVVVDGDGNII